MTYCKKWNVQPDIAVRLRIYITTAHDKYKMLKKKSARPPVKIADVSKKETKSIQLRNLFRSKLSYEIKFKDYYEFILDLNQFYPKKKYVEGLFDSGDESDYDDESSIT